MKKKFSEQIIFVILFSLISFSLFAQQFKIQNPSEILLSLEKLGVLGSVLYIGAHPDDENTSLMAYLSKGEKIRTGYLSLTRGDGGQNLIGSEKGVEIGIIRTQELLQARKIDGAEQFFTRAIDFGYSKSSEETFNIWNKNEVLKDVVFVIRKFKPDIIITRFPVGSSGGHGHHTASALLAEEAFKLAADPNAFPEQLKYAEPWQTKRIFWNNWRPSPNETKGLISVDVGEYNSLLGKSFTEIGALSRSMHKSQGFGASGSRGPRLEYFQLVDGDSAGIDLFDGIDTSWKRITNGESIGKKIESIIREFNTLNPSASIPNLIDIYESLSNAQKNIWSEIKKNEVLEVIKSCAGLWMESIANDYSASPGEQISVNTTIVNRSNQNFIIDWIKFPTIDSVSIVNKNLLNNQPLTIESKIKIPDSYPISQPYWLIDEPGKGLFNVSDYNFIGMAENPPSIPVKIFLDIDGKKLEFTLPLLYRWNDRVDGELYRPFEIRPPVVINLVEKVAIFSNNQPKEIQVKLKSDAANVNGIIHFANVDGWIISPAEIPFHLENKYDEKLVTFSVTPPKNQTETNLEILVKVDDKEFGKSIVEIAYPHIVTQVYFPESNLKLVKLDIKKLEANIGYIMGSGDEIPDCLRNMGYNVTLLSDEMLESNNLAQYDVIITGIRAYNTRDRLKYIQPKLMEYIYNGGTLISQYNIPYGLLVQDTGPYPFKLSQDRITDENAIMNFVDPGNQLLNFPNKITSKDFDGWVQERGLYFANQWDEKYRTIFTGHDVGENDLQGSTLFTHYGKGVYIYSGLSWFRQLPAGVPGAYKIFVNMISSEKYEDGTRNK